MEGTCPETTARIRQTMANSKFLRQYERTRKLLDELSPQNYKAVLNTLFHVYPVAFETPRLRRRIRDAFAAHRTELDLASINMARLYQRSPATKIAICCMPKSGSTFVLTSLKRLKTLEFDTIYLQSPYMNPDFVQALSREHEIDELSLLMSEIRARNWLSHMHTKWTPYTEKVFAAFGVKPIITYRNIFDCLVSMDDMLMNGEVAGFPMVRLPKSYRRWGEGERLTFLCDYVGPWYIDFVVSWARAKIPLLRLDYLEDIKGFDRPTAEKLLSLLPPASATADDLLRAFDLQDAGMQKSARLNKGIAGRGERIPGSARERLKALTWAYRDEVDFSKVI